MSKRHLWSGLAALALSAGVAAQFPGAEPPVFIEASQYTAVLDQGAQHWRLLASDGVDLSVNAIGSSCLAGRRVPEGVWFVTRDAAGQPVLSAPSVTPLPNGYPEQVPLLACGTSSGGRPHVSAPQELIDWLSYNTGAILVQN